MTKSRLRKAYERPLGNRLKGRAFKLVRGPDRAYRYGGEEFVILLPEQALAGAMIAVERVHQAVEGLTLPREALLPPGSVTISGGVTAVAPGQHTTADALLQAADAALYQVKVAGRNRIVAYGDADGSAGRDATRREHPLERPHTGVPSILSL